ncbi:MAG: hypothetical protein ACKO45_04575 [Cyanobium sp.]
MLPSQLLAADLSYRGLIEFDHGSSLPDIPKGSRYIVDFVLNGDVPDTDHSFFENSFENTDGNRGITTFGNFTNPFRYLRFTLDPSGPPALDLANLVFAYGQVNGDFSRVVDVNQPPPTLKPPCDVSPCINEHITLKMRGIPGSPITEVWFNLYNSTFYNPTYASRQLLLDVSDGITTFRFEDLFIHGPETLQEFQSYRTPDFSNLTDAVLFSGPAGTVASGRFLRLEAVPAPLPLLGGAGLVVWSRRLRQRLRQCRS